MGLLRKNIKTATRPIRAKDHGAASCWKFVILNSKL